MTTHIVHKLDIDQLNCLYNLIEGAASPHQSENLTIMLGFHLYEIAYKCRIKIAKNQRKSKLKLTLAEAIALNDWLSGLEGTPGIWFNLLIQKLTADNDKFIVQFKNTHKIS